MIDPNRPVVVVNIGRPNPAAMRKLEDYLIERAIERATKGKCNVQAQELGAEIKNARRYHWLGLN